MRLRTVYHAYGAGEDTAMWGDTFVKIIWFAAFGLLVADVALSVYNTRLLKSNDEAVAHSRLVKAVLDAILADLIDAETGQRGFQITGRNEYLAPYYRATGERRGHLERLQALIADDPEQRAHVGELLAAVAEAETAMRAAIVARATFDGDWGRGFGRQIIESGDGKRAVDRVRNVLDSMEGTEEERLEARSRTAKAAYRSATFTALLAGFLTIGMVGVAFSLVRAELGRRARAETELRASEARFRTLTEAVPQMVWNANAAGEATYFNHRWTEYTGLPVQDAGSDWWIQVVDPEDAARIERAWHAAIRGRTDGLHEEVRVRNARDGSYRWFSTQVVPLRDARGDVEQWIGSLSDIDQQKRQAEVLESLVRVRTAELQSANDRLREEVAERTRAEDQARAMAGELARSNGELEKFAYVASHDLQEPLRKIQAFGDRLSTRYAAPLGADGLDYLARMKNAATRMRSLIEDLLAYARVTSKAQPFEPVPLDRVMADVLSDLELRIHQTGGTVDVGPMATIEADPSQMRQLFLNLLGNALKFHKPGAPPSVVVRATAWSDLPPSAEPPAPVGTGYRISVADRGIGIDPAYAERIFEVFQRLHGRGEYEGTGIGLAICRKIVQRHGGAIVARGREGHGTTFIIDLPDPQERT